VASFEKTGHPDETVPILWDFTLERWDIKGLGFSARDTDTMQRYLDFPRVWNHAQVKNDAVSQQ
jgi:hypothetical protein